MHLYLNYSKPEDQLDETATVAHLGFFSIEHDIQIKTLQW